MRMYKIFLVWYSKSFCKGDLTEWQKVITMKYNDQQHVVEKPPNIFCTFSDKSLTQVLLQNALFAWIGSLLHPVEKTDHDNKYICVNIIIMIIGSSKQFPFHKYMIETLLFLETEFCLVDKGHACKNWQLLNSVTNHFSLLKQLKIGQN